MVGIRAKRSQFRKEFQVSSVKSGKLGGQPSVSSCFQLYTSNFRRNADRPGGRNVQNEPNFPPVPGGSGSGERGPWRAIVQNEANLSPVSGNGRAGRHEAPCRADCAKRSQFVPGRAANVRNKPNSPPGARGTRTGGRGTRGCCTQTNPIPAIVPIGRSAFPGGNCHLSLIPSAGACNLPVLVWGRVR